MDVTTKEWIRWGQTMNTPRAKHRTLMIGANIMLIGGQTSLTADMYFSAEKWNPSNIKDRFDISVARWPDVPGAPYSIEAYPVYDPSIYYDCAVVPPLPTIQSVNATGSM